MIVLDASVDTLHNCPEAGAKLELRRSHCSLVPPMQQFKQSINMWHLKPSQREQANAML